MFSKLIIIKYKKKFYILVLKVFESQLLIKYKEKFLIKQINVNY